MDKAKCYNCENINEVKIASGHSKPENKGKKYFTCAGCEQFNWVENGVGFSPSGLKVDYSKAPDKTLPQTREPVQEVDWAAKDRQSMAQTAMKSASEIIAAQMNVGSLGISDDPIKAVKNMANEFYLELKSMKSKT